MDMQVIQYYGKFVMPMEFAEEQHVSMALCHDVVFNVIQNETEEELCQVGTMKKVIPRSDIE
jgi:hypothetical protein